jgi:hypothetical protein
MTIIDRNYKQVCEFSHTLLEKSFHPGRMDLLSSLAQHSHEIIRPGRRDLGTRSHPKPGTTFPCLVPN